MILTTAALCLALNIYHESRSEPLAGQHAVAQVTFNRAGRDPNRVCEEVFRPKQFSWANPLTESGANRPKLAARFMPKDKKAWDMARSVAKITVEGQVQDFTAGATFYHTQAVRPVWRKKLTLIAIIGHHKFYKVA